jgi:hypothetical protein
MRPLLALPAVLLLTSPTFSQSAIRRCATPERDLTIMELGPATDCAYTSTNPAEQYEPIDVWEIPVVFHVIQRTNGEGFVAQSLIESQIEVLNEDFRALQGTPGAPGLDTRIQFRLAKLDPNGMPTTGVTYSMNNMWFNDSGAYWNSLGWDTTRYMNVYTNSAGGDLGYVPDIPQGGVAGTPQDRVVLYWEVVGRNAPYGPPYDQGRALTHEIGHYLGLCHTFEGGCAPAGQCYTNGDLICDTNPESNPNFDCNAGSSSCGSTDAVHNYMNYSDDTCLWEYTLEQARRMRCTLQFYRPFVYDLPEGAFESFCNASDDALASCPCGNVGALDTGCDIQQATGGVGLSVVEHETAPGNGLTLQGVGFPVASTPTAIVIRGTGIDTGSPVAFGDGLRCVSAPIVRLGAAFANAGESQHTFGHGAMAGTGSFYYQLWFRNTPAMFCTPDAFNLASGVIVDW